MVDIYRQELENRPEAPGGFCWLQVLRSAFWIVAVAAIALSYAWIQLEKLDTRYEIERLQADNRKLSERVDALRVEHARMVSHESVERMARERGFVRIDQGVRVVQGFPITEGGPALWADNRSRLPLP